MRLRALKCIGASCGTKPCRHLHFLASTIAVATSALCVMGARASDHVPDWVKAAAAQPLPHFSETTKAVVLLEDETYTVGPDGRAVDHVRKVVKILRPQGREFAYPFVMFDKDRKVLSLHAWSIDPAGHEYAIKDSDFIEVGHPGGGNFYEDVKAKVTEPPGRDPGGVVAWEYERRERPYLAETTWEFQGDLPRVNQTFTLVLPENFTYATTWAHHEKVDAADLENHHYRWEMNNEKAIDLDETPLAPESAALAGRMTVHYAGPGLVEPQEGSWKGIGQWYDGLDRDRLAPTPEMTEKATELTAGKTDFFEKAEAIGDFVQQKVRYFVIEMGVGGYQPHAAGDIFKNRYGDCKDKATLLSAMLSTVGIHSALLMVDTDRGVIDPDAPSIVGNHMIGAIEIPSGYESPKLHSVVTLASGKRYLIFDPTWDKTPFGQLEDNLQGSYGLLLEGEHTEIIRLPVMSPDLNHVSRSASFSLSADGVLNGSVVEKRFGDLAERRRMILGSEDAAHQQQYVDRAVSHDLNTASVTGLKIDNLEALNLDLTTSYDVNAAHFASVTGPLLMVRPRVLGTFALDVNRKERRRVPIDLGQTMTGTDQYEITLPPGYVVDELPDPVKVDVGFASYESSTTVRDGKLHYARTYTQREVSLPASKYAEVQKLSWAIQTDEESRAVLKRAAQTAKEISSTK